MRHPSLYPHVLPLTRQTATRPRLVYDAHGHNAFIFIDKPITEFQCVHNFKMAAWDPDLGICFRLFHVDGQSVYPVDNDVADKL